MSTKKESLCKPTPHNHLTLAALIAALTLSSACGGAVGKDDLNSATANTQTSIADVAKECADSKKASEETKKACDDQIKSCEDTKRVCEMPTPSAMTTARCQALMPAANRTFTKCGAKMESGKLWLDVANKSNPALKDVDCVVNLTGILGEGTIPINNLHVTQWSDAGDLILKFWIDHPLGRTICEP